MTDIIIVLILLVIIGTAVFYIKKEKKKGIQCVGCPSNCSGCSSGEGKGTCNIGCSVDKK